MMIFLIGILVQTAASQPGAAKSFGLATADHLRPVGVRVTANTHRGKKCVRVVGALDFKSDQLAILEGSAIENGVIEADVAGQPLPGASSGARGFVGIAFR